MKNHNGIFGKMLSAAGGQLLSREDYAHYGVMQGLRTPEGTGIPVILTKISDVIGYKTENGHIVPVDGRLIYRGYEINDLVNGSTREGKMGFEEVAYLLISGDLPPSNELGEFSKLLNKNRALPEDFVRNFILPLASQNIMNQLATSVNLLYRFDKSAEDTSPKSTIVQCLDLVAKFPAIIAYSYVANQHLEKGKSLYLHHPNGSLSTAESFLSMLREDRNYTPLEAKVLDVMMMLHADHGGANNSTFTLRTVASSGSDTYSVIGAALSSLKGPLHGGADSKVAEMMRTIKKEISPPYTEGKVMKTLVSLLNGEIGDKSGLIYGQGHAVYKLSDPRAVIIKGYAERLAEQAGRTEEFKLYDTIQRLAPKAVSEVKGREIPAATNIDFYASLVYDLLRLPEEVNTPLFAMARIAGWTAHLVEQRVNFGTDKIIRPASKYAGPPGRPYVPLGDR
jgi:citrate synthase